MKIRVLKISTIVHHNLYTKTAEVPVGRGRGTSGGDIFKGGLILLLVFVLKVASGNQ